MLLVFRTLNFFALGAILLTPFWLFNSTLDRLLPPAPAVSVLSPRTDAAVARLRDQLVSTLGTLKQSIHADMCRRDGGRLCVLTVCVPLTESAAQAPARCR